MTDPGELSRRERQIMDALYKLEQGSVRDVLENIYDPPSYSAVRTLLQKLVDKGHIAHKESGKKYVYFPLINRKKASKTALSRVVSTFFSDSAFMAMNSLLDMSTKELTDEELEQLTRLIEEKRKQR